MGAVDIGVERGEFVVERIAHKALSRQVIALVGLDVVDHPVDAGVAFEGGGVQFQAVANVLDAGKPVFGILQRDPADDAVDLVALGQQPFRE